MTAYKVERLLKSLVGELNVSAGLSHRQNHGQDCSYHIGKHPELVAWPQSTLQVTQIATNLLVQMLQSRRRYGTS